MKESWFEKGKKETQMCKNNFEDKISKFQCNLKERHPLFFEMALMIFSGILVPILTAVITTNARK